MDTTETKVHQAVTRAAKGHRFMVFNMFKQGSLTPDITEQYKGKRPYVYFGHGNVFPEFVRAVADNCGPLGASVEKLAQYIAGGGMEFLTKDEKPVAQAEALYIKWMQGQNEADFRYATALDVALLQAKSWDVVPGVGSESGLTGPIAALHHKDVSRLRAKRKVKTDGVWKVPGYVWCCDWETASGKSWEALVKDENLKPDETVVFDRVKPSTTEKSTIYTKAYRQNYDYYGIPWWLPALTDAEVWALIPVFNRVQINTGFRPAFHIHVFGVFDDEDEKQLRKDIETYLTGGNGQAFTLTTGTVAEGKPEITKLERGDHAGELDAIRTGASDAIYEAYGVPKVLMNVDIESGLGGKGIALVEEEAAFVAGKVKPLQDQFICNDLKMLMHLSNIKEVDIVRIKQLSVYQSKTDPELMRMGYLRSTTVNEHREQQGRVKIEGGMGEKFLIEVGPTGGQTPAAP